ncbi:MAG: hypothetical protein AAGE59_20385 [Cyanobacteria bacterium P01_F01_bin.86]
MKDRPSMPRNLAFRNAETSSSARSTLSGELSGPNTYSDSGYAETSDSSTESPSTEEKKNDKKPNPGKRVIEIAEKRINVAKESENPLKKNKWLKDNKKMISESSNVSAKTGSASSDFDNANALQNEGEGTDWKNTFQGDGLQAAYMIDGAMGALNARADMQNMFKGRKEFQKGLKAASGLGKVARGGTATVNYFAKKDKESNKEDKGDSNVSAVPDEFDTIAGVAGVGAGSAYVTGSAAEAMEAINQIIDLCETWSQTTGVQKLGQGLDIAKNAAKSGQSGTKLGLAVVKAVGDFSGKTADVGVVDRMGDGIAGLGLVMGAIELAQGGFEIYRSFSTKRNIEETEKHQNEIVEGIQQNINELSSHIIDDFGTVVFEDLDQILPRLETLRNTLISLNEAAVECTPAMAAMKKLSGRKMESGAFKAAQGGLNVVSNSLMLSGVGAPIAITTVTLATLMGLGKLGLQKARDNKAGTLTDIATKLTDEGKFQKPKEDEEAPKYRKMESRIYKYYYNHLPEVIEGKKTVDRFQSNEFKAIKHFSWQDKKSRIKYSEKYAITSTNEARGLSEQIRRSYWLEVQAKDSKATQKEKPKRIEKAAYMISVSAHKSKQADSAAKGEVANVLYALCAHSYDRKTQSFVDAKLVPIGNVNATTLEEYKGHTLRALLKATNMSDALWKKWLEKAEFSASGKLENDEKSKDLEVKKQKLTEEIQKIMKDNVKKLL